MRNPLKVVLVLLLGMLGISIFGLVRMLRTPLASISLPLEVEILSGPTVLTGKPTIVEFWATWCPPCRQTIPHLNKIHADYSPRGLQIVGITDEDPTTVKTFQRSLPMEYTVARDPKGRYLRELGIRGIPVMFLLDASGKVVWQGNPAAFKPDEWLPKLLGS